MLFRDNQVIGNYRILSILGGGGMGTVYHALDTRLGRPVAIKFLSEKWINDPVIQQRFMREAQANSRLNHPNICTVYDIGQHGNQPYLVMEFLKGETLKERLAGRPLDVPTLLDWTIQICKALEFAHSHGIVHRDIKPSNVFVTEGGTVRLLDFGLAKLFPETYALDDPESTTAHHDYLTGEGHALGTVSHMSPEQARGEELDHRTDIFSLGIVLYEMATGKLPFDGTTSAVIFDQILNREPVPVSRQPGSSPLNIDAIVSRALAKDASLRYQTAHQLAADLARLERSLTPTTFAPRRDFDFASIAVLPFRDMSPDEDQGYFCAGLAEELISALSKVANLHVASSTSSFAYRGKDVDIRQIGSRLNVTTVLEGSVRKADDRLRVSAQLINVADGFHLWAGRYDRQFSDLFAIQENIAGEIAQVLKVQLGETEKQAHAKATTRDIEAFEFYGRGRQFFNQPKRRSIELAIDMFKRAVQKDPEYALAFCGLADCWSYLYMYFDHNESNLRSAQEASRQALELDSRLAEAHASCGLAASLSREYEQAEREFETAILLNPRLFEAYYFYGRTSFAQGHPKKAARLYEQASKVNPDDYQALSMLAFTYRSLGETEKAVKNYGSVLQLIRSHITENPDDSRAIYLGAEALLGTGHVEEAFEWAARVIAIDPDDPYLRYGIACLYAKTGQHEYALNHLERAISDGFAHLDWIKHDSDFDELRPLPRFQLLIAQLGEGT